MITIRKAQDRGTTRTDWLISFHTFSFGDYYDPRFMHFGTLRVINEDTVQPGKGFPTHPHRDMEIITYVTSGTLEHKDSMGNGSLIKPGEIQRMSAGTGITHSEFNHSKNELVHLLQIWILPNQKELTPSYEQKSIAKINNQFILIGAQNPSKEAVTIHQDVKLYVAYLEPNNLIHYTFENQRKGWLQLIKGKINLNDQALSPGDGAMISSESDIQIKSLQESEFLFFDLE